MTLSSFATTTDLVLPAPVVGRQGAKQRGNKQEEEQGPIEVDLLTAIFQRCKKVVLTTHTYGRCAREGERGVERKEKRNGKRKSRAKRNPKKRGKRRRGRPQKVSGLSAPASFEKVNHCDINPTFSRLSSARRPSPPPTRLLPQKRKKFYFFQNMGKKKKNLSAHEGRITKKEQVTAVLQPVDKSRMRCIPLPTTTSIVIL